MKVSPKGRLARLSVFCFSLLGPGLLHAQTTVAPEDEYKKLIRVSEDIQPLGEHPFGESISLYDGSLSFQQTDVSASGTGPLMQLTRQFQIEGSAAIWTRGDYAFGDWTLALPRIETLTANGYSGARHVTGWQVDVAPDQDPNARCSHFARPYSVVMHPSDPALTPWEPETWWKGYHMVIPGQGTQDLLANDDDASKATYPIITKDHWRISCPLKVTANGEPGEGFLAQAPDGARYWFNELVYRRADSLSRPLYSGVAAVDSTGARGLVRSALKDPVGDLISLLSGSGVAHALPSSDVLSRQTAWMLVTRIEDRFGNSLVFNYDSSGHLTGINASDGRALSVTYETGTPRIHSVTLQPAAGGAARTWLYTYNADGSSLTQVTLPDNTRWQLGLTAFDQIDLNTSGSHSSCVTLAAPNPATATGTISHPAGLVGTFVVKPVKRGRSYVPRDCRSMQYGDPDSQGSFASVPDAWYSVALVQRTLSGAGTPNRTWSYSYSPANDSWYDCGSNCATTVYTTVVDPDLTATRSTFSNRYNYTESQLLRTDYYAGGAGTSTLLRSEINHYAAPTTAPLPARAGHLLQDNVNTAQIAQYSPLDQRQMVQGGDTYTWQAEAFNSYVQVTRTKRSSSAAAPCVADQVTMSLCALEEQTDYLNELPHWVLGLPTKVTNLTTGEVVDQNVYDLSRVTLKERWHFGQKLMSYTFDAQGNLASFTDGNSHTTTLGSYKRGIPQAIGYPDGRSQSLAVDDFGQIARITDQAGSATAYSYDAVGRLKQIAYPTGDEQAWYPKTFNYDFVAGAERGIAANHWRRTIATGNARSVTYFDALLRPVLADSYSAADGSSHTSARTDYDWKGQKTFVSYPVPGSPSLASITTGSTSTYDALGRLTRTQQVSELGTLTSTTAYLSGARMQVTDPKGNVTTTRYQVFDQPSYDAVIQVQAPAGLTQTIERDLYGNPRAITQSGLYGTQSLNVRKTLIYDGYHRLCRTTEPESGSEVMAYDAANNLLWSASGVTLTDPQSTTDCGQTQVATAGRTTRTYDAMNRVTHLTPPAGTQSTTYSYDALGNLASAVSGISTWTATHNKRGMVTAESLQLTGQGTWWLHYNHDAYGSLSSLQYPDGETVSYAPDALGRATRVGSYVTGLSYFPDGEVASYTYGNGASYVAEKNARQLLSNFSYGHGTTLNLSEDYSYDANGNITKVTDLAGGPRTKTFGYDALNRLTSATASSLWGTETYAYDPLNNIRKRVGNGQTVSYNYDALNHLVSLSGATSASFGYDNRGNIINKNGAALAFDQKNQLTGITGYGNYSYDAAGRRVMKAASGHAPVYYFYNQGGQLLYQRDSGSTLSTNFIYLGRKLVADSEQLNLVAPASLNASSNPNDGSYTLSWGSVTGASSYTLQESANGGSWVTVYTGAGTSKALSGKAGGSYVYHVRGCAGSTCSGWRASTTVGVRPALTRVSVPSGTINGSYTVSWAATTGATGYDVQERLGSGSWTTLASNTVATSISRPGASSGSYTYQVSAKNAYGSRGWAGSSAVTVDTTYGVLPATPASLSVPGSSSTGSGSLSWSATSLTTRYTVQESANGGASWATIYNSSGTATSVSGLANGSYTFRVQACNTYGCSGWRAGSATLSVLHPPASAPSLSAPASSNTGSYTVSWGGVSTSTAYTLQEQVNGGSWATLQNTSATSRAISGKGNGSYGYRVRACNGGGCSGFSATKATVVTHPPASAPTLSVPSSSNTGSYTVSWGAVSTATRYTLREQVNGGSWTTIQSSSARSRAISGKGNGTYGYRVQACNAGGCGPLSSTHTVTVALVPAVPTGAYIEHHTTYKLDSYIAHWNAVTGITRYDVKRNDTGATVYSGTSTSFTLSGAFVPDIPPYFTFSVRACNANGCSAWAVGS